MSYYTEKCRKKKQSKIVSDTEIVLDGVKTSQEYPRRLRLVEAWVEVDGENTLLCFLTDNFDRSSVSICDLYNARWGIEVFFKEMKQTLQLADFLGHNEKAVRWQIWTALLTYVLLRFVKYANSWNSTFPRLFTVIRGVLWSRINLGTVLNICCGTAHGNFK
jgi:IS4 transposase